MSKFNKRNVPTRCWHWHCGEMWLWFRWIIYVRERAKDCRTFACDLRISTCLWCTYCCYNWSLILRKHPPVSYSGSWYGTGNGLRWTVNKLCDMRRVSKKRCQIERKLADLSLRERKKGRKSLFRTKRKFWSNLLNLKQVHFVPFHFDNFLHFFLLRFLPMMVFLSLLFYSWIALNLRQQQKLNASQWILIHLLNTQLNRVLNILLS